jgi:hypothetical protein
MCLNPCIVHQPDVRIANHRGLVLVYPLTEDARRWVEQNVQLDAWQWDGDAFAVDGTAYAADLAEGMEADGLTVEVG